VVQSSKKTTCRDGIGYQPEEVVAVFLEVISVSVPSGCLIIIFSLLVLTGTSYSLLFFLFVVTASPTCRILLFLIGIFPLQTAEVPLVCVRTTFKMRTTSPLRSSFSPSSRCFLPFCYHQPFSS
jgi:hypothetical protein